MTDTDTMTDEEITRILAELMGWTPSETDPGYYYDKDGTRHFPEFLTDGNYMLMVIDAMREKGYDVFLRSFTDGRWCAIVLLGEELIISLFADTAQRAVCNAAVKTIREGRMK